jgi:hypothetical protein
MLQSRFMLPALCSFSLPASPNQMQSRASFKHTRIVPLPANCCHYSICCIAVCILVQVTSWNNLLGRSYKVIPVFAPDLPYSIQRFYTLAGILSFVPVIYPEIRDGDYVVCKEIQTLESLIYGDIYLVITKDGIEPVKYIHPRETNQDWINLVSYNK